MNRDYRDIDVEPEGEEFDSHTQLLATLVHLSGFLGVLSIAPIGPLIFWLLTRDNHPFLDDQGKEALNFQISIAIYFVISLLLMVVGIGIILFGIVTLFWIIAPIIAAVKANSGEWYRYPLTIRLVQ